MRLSVIFLWLLVAGLLAAVSIVLVDVATGWSIGLLHGVSAFSLYFAVHMLPAGACAWVRERGRLGVLMVSGIVASFASLGVVLLAALGLIDAMLPYELAPLAGVPAIWSASMMLIGMLTIPLFPPGLMNIVRSVSIFLIALLTVHGLAWLGLTVLFEPVMSWETSNDFHEGMARIGGILGVMSGCGAIATYIMARARKLTGRSDVVETERLPFTITCPRCNAAAALRTGGDLCHGCGLRITVNPA